MVSTCCLTVSRASPSSVPSPRTASYSAFASILDPSRKSESARSFLAWELGDLDKDFLRTCTAWSWREHEASSLASLSRSETSSRFYKSTKSRALSAASVLPSFRDRMQVWAHILAFLESKTLASVSAVSALA